MLNIDMEQMERDIEEINGIKAVTEETTTAAERETK